MRRGVVLLLLALSSLTGCISRSEISDTWLSRPGDEALSSVLPPILKNDVAVMVDVDGKFYLVNTDSRKIVWSWSSGLPIYSSSHTSDSFIDCSDDWHLYFFHNNTRLMKVPLSAEEYVRSTPTISKDGSVTLGSRKTTVFVVDAASGNLIRTYKLPDSPSGSADISSTNANPVVLMEEPEQQLLYIKRTDYALHHHHHSHSSDSQPLWSVSFAEFDASFEFPGFANELGPPHKIKPVVLRIRDRGLMESLSVFDKTVHGLPGGKPLPLPSSADDDDDDDGLVPWPFPSALSPQHSEMIFLGLLLGIVAKYPLQYSIPALFFLVSLVAVLFYRYLVFRKRKTLEKDAEQLRLQAKNPKKKKNRKLGNKKSNSMDVNNASGDLPSVNAANGNLEIGKLVVSRKEIAKGSNGTVVVEGIHDGRPVAVKRLVRTHHDVAYKEIEHLIASDKHPNVVRFYGVEKDDNFVYIALERCTCNLNDFIYIFSESFQSQEATNNPDSQLVDEYTLRLHEIKGNNRDVNLWKPNGYPTPQLLKLMRDVVSGIEHLHELGIIHRDLKPQNVLINKDKILSATLSDMGISKRLPADMSSITMHATGYGSSGWQAPEQLQRQRQTLAVDLFSLGCVLFFCVTGGKHPFGDTIERDFNIVNDRKDLFLVNDMPEALDLFTRLLDPDPDMRPKAKEVLHHPFFWSQETRLSFLREVSDRVETEDREEESDLLDAVENTAAVVLDGKWDEKLEWAFINNIGRYRRYNYESIRDLLRVIRNKSNHYEDLPQDVKELLGPVPEGFEAYFSARFPKLLIEVYKVIFMFCGQDPRFLKFTTTTII